MRAYRTVRWPALYAAAAMFALPAGISPAQAQSAAITLEEVTSGCANEIRAKDEEFLAQRRFALPGYIRARDIHIKQGNTGEVALFQKNIDDVQADIDDLTARGFQSSRSWVQTVGQANVSTINDAAPAKLRQYAAAQRKNIEQGVAVNDARIFGCALSLRLAKLKGR